MKTLIRLVVALFTVVVILVVAGVLLLDRIVKEVVENRIRSTTGMDVEIGQMDVGLLTPTLTIENFKLYNNADFGGAVFLDMPELHLEYDVRAVRSGELHLTLVRLNLAEIAIVQDKKGRMNFEDLNRKTEQARAMRKSAADYFKFTGIDTLNLTVGKLQISNRATGRDEEINFGIKNQIFHDIKSEGDMAGLSVIMAARAGMLSNGTNSGIDLNALLKNLTAH